VWDPAKRRFKHVVVTVEASIIGPIVSYGGDRYAVKRTALNESGEPALLWSLGKARRTTRTRWGPITLGTPLLNLFVAGREGRIAWSPAGLLQIRDNLPLIKTSGCVVVNYSFMPFNAGAGEGVWEGLIARGSLRILVDPRRPFLANSNGRPFKGHCSYTAGITHYVYEFDSVFRRETLRPPLQNGRQAAGISISDLERPLEDRVGLGVEYMAKTLSHDSS